MEHQFWRDRWQQNNIAFHQRDFNAYLVQFAHLLPEGPVFVPLCGKTRDMLFLSQQHPVIGCELVESAVEDFYKENNIAAEKHADAPFTRYEGGGVRIYAGDFFGLDVARIGSIHSIFDRAAMIALPESMRQKYLEHLLSLLPVGGVCLLIGLSHKSEPPSGPPFSVPFTEVRERVSSRASIELLQESDLLMGRPDLQQRGYTSYREWVARLTRL